jgi:hypothetical protein
MSREPCTKVNIHPAATASITAADAAAVNAQVVTFAEDIHHCPACCSLDP